MAEENEHILSLIAARDKAIEQRRVVVKSLAKYKRGYLDSDRDFFASIQTTIDAMERAIAHEQFIESKKPGPFLAPLVLKNE